ncbi:MAG: hypothetical protein V1809_10350 [Planctomycetota bacterium]
MRRYSVLAVVMMAVLAVPGFLPAAEVFETDDTVGWVYVPNYQVLRGKLDGLVNQIFPGMGVMVSAGIRKGLAQSGLSLEGVDKAKPAAVIFLAGKAGDRPVVGLFSLTSADNFRQANAGFSGGFIEIGKAVAVVGDNKDAVAAVAARVKNLTRFEVKGAAGDFCVSGDAAKLRILFRSKFRRQGAILREKAKGGLMNIRGEGALLSPAVVDKAVQGAYEALRAALCQVTRVDVAVTIQPDGILVENRAGTVPGSALATFLAAQKGGAADRARFLPADGVVHYAGGVFDPASVYALGKRVLDRVLARVPVVSPNRAAALKILELVRTMDGDVVQALVVRGNRPVSLVLCGAKDGNAYEAATKTAFDQLRTGLAGRVFGGIGVEYRWKGKAREYKGVAVDAIDIVVLPAADRAVRQFVEQNYGKESKYELALVKGTAVTAWGVGCEAVMNETLDRILAGQEGFTALDSYKKAAARVPAGAAYVSQVFFLNTMRLAAKTQAETLPPFLAGLDWDALVRDEAPMTGYAVPEGSGIRLGVFLPLQPIKALIVPVIAAGMAGAGFGGGGMAVPPGLQGGK